MSWEPWLKVESVESSREKIYGKIDPDTKVPIHCVGVKSESKQLEATEESHPAEPLPSADAS